jgi:hypothetical protein
MAAALIDESSARAAGLRFCFSARRGGGNAAQREAHTVGWPTV